MNPPVQHFNVPRSEKHIPCSSSTVATPTRRNVDGTKRAHTTPAFAAAAPLSCTWSIRRHFQSRLFILKGSSSACVVELVYYYLLFFIYDGGGRKDCTMKLKTCRPSFPSGTATASETLACALSSMRFHLQQHIACDFISARFCCLPDLRLDGCCRSTQFSSG